MKWQQQTDKPLFPNLLWSRPETKYGAGKLLIIGGQAQEFLHVAAAYAAAETAGAGVIRVLMPDSTRKITSMLPNIEYAPSNLSGSFARTALADLLDASLWSDGVLLAGNLGKNSETNLMLESFIASYSGQLVVAYEALESITISLADLQKRPNTIIVGTFTELQKIGIELQLEKPIVSSIGNPELSQLLSQITRDQASGLIIQRSAITWTSYQGQTASTTTQQTSSVAIAAHNAVWAMQNPAKIFEAITTGTWCAAH